ncbi:MAG TPA: CocE/NonD family hydrolase [Steroidobacteraceae bacterium]
MRPANLLIVLCLIAAPAVAQQIRIPAEITDEAAWPRVMPRFAKALIAFQHAEQHPELTSLFKAQLVAGLYGDALASLDKLRAPLAADPSPRVRARYLDYLLYARARLTANETKTPFQGAYRKAFHALISRLDNKTSALAVNRLGFDNLSQANQALEHDLAELKGKTAISPAESLQLISDYSEREIYRAFGPISAELIAQDDSHRYVIQKDVMVALPDGGSVCALIIRPLRQAKLPALLQFTIYDDTVTLLGEARRAASNDYVGVMGLTRGKGCSPGETVPYEHDGADAAALVGWIAAQPWSDGKVGMYGGSYSGFTPWAAAKHQPKALRSIMVGAPVAPGVDVPMEGNVVWNFIYPWPFYTTTNKLLNNGVYFDRARWAKLDHDWYASGRPYRDLDKIDGTPNPIFDRWISHSAYDVYWQSMIPYKEEFSRISMPVLQTAGYYYGGPGAAVYYLTQHVQYRPNAEDYLIIGPYEHFMAQRGTANAEGDVDTLAGYKLDPAAKIDLTEVRYRWFDYTLKGGAKPAILADKINYEVTGANLWKHAPSIAAMATQSVRYFLSADGAGVADHDYRLSGTATAGAIPLSVDLADRRDVDAQTPGGGIRDKGLDAANGLVFFSEPLAKPMEMSGLFSGHLEFIANKSDFDLEIRLFERSADGDYFQLAPYWSRASYVQDLTHRNLLSAGKRQSLDFRSVRLMSRQLEAGSRLVAVLSVVKEPGREINYGTGGEVIDESIADAKTPLQITWFGGSYLDLPAHR